MKKILLAAALASCFVSNLAGAASDTAGCGTFSSDVQKELDSQAERNKVMRDLAAERDLSAAEMISAPRVDVKALSCVDKYMKMKIIVAFPWPNIDMLFDKLYSMACNMVDQKVNEMTGKLAQSTKLPYGLGSLGGKVGYGGDGSSAYEIREQNQDISGRVIDGIFH
jgi:hypothetical protein